MTAAKSEPLFTFVQFSDVHVGSKHNQPLHRRLQAAVALTKALKPAFVIDTGDVTTHPVYRACEEYLAELDDYRRYADSLACPLYVVPGNHDIGYADPGNDTWGDGHPWGDHTRLVEAFEFMIGPLDQSFCHKGMRFVLVNNNPVASGEPGALSLEQLAWIEQELARGETAFVFCHVELLERGTGPLWGASAKTLAGLCKDYGVPAVAYGHRHQLRVTPVEGTHYIMCPDLYVPGHEHILQYRVFARRFELWRYHVFSGLGEQLASCAFPQRSLP